MPIFSKPQYSAVQVKDKKKSIPYGIWRKCPLTKEIIYNKDLENNLMVSPDSGYHFSINAINRIESLIDSGTFKEYDVNLSSIDSLKFKGVSFYSDKIKENEEKTGQKSAVISGIGYMDGIPVSLAVMDFRFLGASMDSVVGEKITRTIERGIKFNYPVIIISASGGARMYEGALSLMQMAKTSAALGKLSESKLPYISILTNPTMAGVMASYGSLGDLILAEPGALIGFAGPRVIKETTQQLELPKGFQSAEFLFDCGLIDQIVDRRMMRNRIIEFLNILYVKNNLNLK